MFFSYLLWSYRNCEETYAVCVNQQIMAFYFDEWIYSNRILMWWQNLLIDLSDTFLIDQFSCRLLLWQKLHHMGVSGSHCCFVQPCCVQGRPGNFAHPEAWGSRRRFRVGPAEVHRALLWLSQSHEGQKQKSGRNPFQLHQQVPGLLHNTLKKKLSAAILFFKCLHCSPNATNVLPASSRFMKTKMRMTTVTSWWWRGLRRGSSTAVPPSWSRARSSLWMMRWRRLSRMPIWNWEGWEREYWVRKWSMDRFLLILPLPCASSFFFFLFIDQVFATSSCLRINIRKDLPSTQMTWTSKRTTFASWVSCPWLTRLVPPCPTLWASAAPLESRWDPDFIFSVSFPHWAVLTPCNYVASDSQQTIIIKKITASTVFTEDLSKWFSLKTRKASLVLRPFFCCLLTAAILFGGVDT